MTDIRSSPRRVGGETGSAQSGTAEAGDLTVEDSDAIAASKVGTLPIDTRYVELAGPFYGTTGLTHWLGISKQALAKRVDAGTVIACQETARGTWMYPTWQFTGHAVIAGLADIWQILRHGAAADPWMAVFWLKAANPALSGVAPVDWLYAGGDLDIVVAEARADAARWVACV